MKNIRKELEEEEGKPGLLSVRWAVLRVYMDNLDMEYTVSGMVKIMDERYAFKTNPTVARKTLRKLTREGILIRKPVKSEGGRGIYHYRVRKPGE